MSLFITLEGVEGCGKSTQAKRLAKRLKNEGFDCLVTREPGGTPIGREIRRIILAPAHREMCAETELGLYFSDRAQHLREEVWPALEAGTIVVCDRFTDSTLAYQGYGRGISLRLIRSIDREPWRLAACSAILRGMSTPASPSATSTPGPSTVWRDRKGAGPLMGTRRAA